MNVALCFSGGVKYPNNGLNSLKKIFPNCNIKIFMHTWDIHKKSDYLKTVHGIKHKEVQKTVITNFDFLSKFLYENLLIENYDTKQIEFQSFYDELKFKDYPTTSDGKTIGIGMISMHYSIWKSNELKKYYEKEHDMKFDVVVRMRYDSEFPETINFLEYDEDVIYIPWGDDWLGGINDQFAIGNSKVLDAYSCVFKHLQDYQHLSYHPETIMRNHLDTHNIKIKRIKFPVRINNGVDFRRDFHPDDFERHFKQWSPDYQ